MVKKVLELKGLKIEQSGQTILDQVDMQIGPGELVYLIGRTGSGKTSLLRSLYGDLPIKGGTAEVAGYKVNRIGKTRLPFLRRKIGIIFQDFQLLTDRNVIDNLSFVMKATGWKKKSLMKNRLDKVLELVGLQDKRNKFPHELSGGEQQRVVIARALINEPFVLLADEPTGNLDPYTSREIQDLLIQITSEGTAMLMATHNYNLIDYHPSRVFRIEEKHCREIKDYEIQELKTIYD